MTAKRSGRGRAGQRLRAVVAATARGGPLVCWLCGRPIGPDEPWDVDHVVPLSRGGTDDPANLRPAHASENRARGNGAAATWQV